MPVMRGYTIILILSWILVAMNVRWSLIQFRRDRSLIRLSAHFLTVIILGTLISFVAKNVASRVLDAEDVLEKSVVVHRHVVDSLEK
jgi:hypothetical protein